MLHEPRCLKCGTNRCLVVYRRNNGNPEWVCAVCSGLRSDQR